MKRIKALEDINRSAHTMETPGTYITGFAERLVRQYGVRAVSWAVDRSQLDPVYMVAIKRWIAVNERRLQRDGQVTV